MHKDKAIEMKRMVLDYIKTLRRTHLNNSQIAGEDVTKGIQKDTIQIDSSGFPVAPRPQSWNNVTRSDLEPLYRLYLTRHYRKSFSV
jgi:hypothetical protein